MPLAESWVRSTGLHCDCPVDVPPVKRPRGRPRQYVDGCRRCWRSLCTDRDFPSPHGVSLATRFVEEHPDLSRQVATEALKHALPAAGFILTQLTAVLPLPDGTNAPKAFGWVAFGWRDKRDNATFVQRSSTEGGGLFAAIDLNPDVHLHKYEGAQVAAKVMRRDDYARGYVMRIGPHYVDARDPAGRLRLSNGAHIGVHSYSDADWHALEESGQRGVAWEGGCANLSRFVNHSETPNAKFSRGWLVTTMAVKAGDELFVRYCKDFWLECDQ